MAGTFSKQVEVPKSPLEHSVTLVNISDERWVINRSYRPYVIPARNKATGYSALKIVGHNAIMDMGDNRRMNVLITADEIAADLEREINTDIPSDDNATPSFAGVFTAEAELPSAYELEQARERLKKFSMVLVRMADAEWDASHKPGNISADWRRAARFLGLDKEWLYDQQQQMTECPACAERIKPGVAVCKACGAVLDRAKAEKYGLVRSEEPQEPETPAPAPRKRVAGN